MKNEFSLFLETFRKFINETFFNLRFVDLFKPPIRNVLIIQLR